MSKAKEEVLETPPEAAEPAADKDPKTEPDAAAVTDAADATEGTEEEPQSPPTPEEQIAQLTDAVAEAKDKHLRLRAELDNFRKRSQRDISSARIIGKTSAIESILPIVDHFGMAMMAADQENADIATLKQGMQMIHTELERCLEALGLEKILTDGKFDPKQHEAVSTESSDDVPAENIIHEWKAGYRLGEAVLRAAMVVVSTGPEVAAEEAGDEVTDDEVAGDEA